MKASAGPGKGLKGRVLRLGKEIGYRKDSIVSKTLLDRKGGSLTLFAFDAGQRLSEHTAPFDAMVQVIEGEAELVIGGVSLRCGAGECVVMPARVPHAVTAVKAFKMLLIMIR
ncbi:MAG: cupin domain-containing protein [Kiritimatiellae bacterium]|nr:cupin domain-containing protein [Kiritimatiellia bacterium]